MRFSLDIYCLHIFFIEVIKDEKMLRWILNDIYSQNYNRKIKRGNWNQSESNWSQVGISLEFDVEMKIKLLFLKTELLKMYFLIMCTISILIFLRKWQKESNESHNKFNFEWFLNGLFHSKSDHESNKAEII